MDYQLIGALKEEVKKLDERREAIEKVIILFAQLPLTPAKPKSNGHIALVAVASGPLRPKMNGIAKASLKPAGKRELPDAVIEAIRSFSADTFTVADVMKWLDKHRAHLHARCQGNTSLQSCLCRLAERKLIARTGSEGTKRIWRRLPSLEKSAGVAGVEERYREFKSHSGLETAATPTA